MSKTLRIVVILVVTAIALTSGQDDGGSTVVGAQDDSVNNTDSGDNSETSVTSADDSNGSSSLLSTFGFLLSPVTGLLRILLSPITGLVSAILSMVSSLISGILWPVGSLLNGISSSVSGLLSGITTLVSLLLSSVSALLSLLLGDSSGTTAVQQRIRRNAMDSIMGMMMRMVLYLPFRFVRNIFDVIIMPLGFIYNSVTWLFHFIFGNNVTEDLINVTGIVPYYQEFSAYMKSMISSFLLNLSKSSQAAIYDALIRLWSVMKVQVLPILDHYLNEAVDSGWVPNDIGVWIKRGHTIYTYLHNFGFI